MAQYLQADSPIDPLTVDGTELATRLNRLVDAIDSGQSGNARPATLTAGGIYTKTAAGGEMSVMLYDGTSEHEIGGKYGYIMSKPPAGISQSITAADPGDVPLTLNGAASQTADLLHVATNKFVVKNTGQTVIRSGDMIGLVLSRTNNNRIGFTDTSGGTPYVEISIATTASESALGFVNQMTVNPLVTWSFGSTGVPGNRRMALDDQGRLALGLNTPRTAQLTVRNMSDIVGLKVEDFPGQTADLIQAGVFRVDPAGNAFMGATAVTSDRRLKDNLEPVQNATDKLNSITGYEYDMKGQAFCWPDCPGSRSHPATSRHNRR